MKNNSYSSSDIQILQRCIDKAIEGIGLGGGPFGAVITRNGEIVAEAYNEVVKTGDPTAHAEVLAIRRACEATGSHHLTGCTLYASCEPCPMCLGAIYWAGIEKVLFASGREDAAKAGFGDEEFYDEISRDPVERKIPFTRVHEVEGNALFRAWEKYDKKIGY